MNPRSIGAALLSLVIGVISGSQFLSSSEKLAKACLDQITAIIEQRAKTGQGETVLSPPGQGVDPKKISSSLRNQIASIEKRLVPTLEVGKRMQNAGLHVERMVQKGDGSAKREFIDLLALRPLDLSRGRLGDASRLPDSEDALPLPENLQLSEGERLRIYTTSKFGDPPYGTRLIELKYTKGIWKGDLGDSDRVWIANRQGEVVLDFEYTISNPEVEVSSRDVLEEDEG